MVLESILTDLLNKYLGDYVENLDKKQLKVGIWGGDVVLENLSLRENAFDDLDLPIQLVYGFLGKLVLKIPWKNLYSQPVVAQVEDLYILLSPKQSIRYDPVKEAKYERQGKQAALQNLETRRQIEEEKQKIKGDPTFAEKLTAQIVNNLQIKIANVHIRYEDNTTTNHPIAFGVTLHGLEVYTTDAFWERSYMSGQISKVFKIADLDSLAAYMNCNARIFMQYDLSEFSNLFKSNIAYKGYFPQNYSYIFGPISVITKLKLNMNPERDEPPFLTPKIDLVLGMEKLNIGITRIQFQDILTLCDSINRLQTGVQFRKHRPYGITYKGYAKEWWKFAITCILEDVRRKQRNFSWDHIKQHRKLCKTYAEAFKEKMLTKKPSANLLETVDLCEDKLDIFNLILIRNRAYLELDALKLEEKLKSQKSSWFGTWWGGTRAEDEERSEFTKKFEAAMTPEEKAKLYKAIGYQENVQQLELPETYEAITMKFSLAALEVVVNDELIKVSNTDEAKNVVGTRTIVRLILSWVLCDVSQRPSSNGLTVKMGIKNMVLTGYQQNEFVPKIIKSIVLEEENLLDINFEMNPVDKMCDQRIKVFARPLQIAYDAQTLIQILQVFTAPSSVNVSNLTPAVPITDVKERSALGFQYMVESHPKLEVDVKFLPSIVIVPHSGIYNGETTSVIVLSLGQLTIATDAHKGDDKDVREMFKVGTRKETILKEMMERTYDKFNITVENIQVIVAKANENWTEILDRGELSDMHILCPMALSVTLGLCLIDDDPRLPKKRLKVVIPSVKINVIEERIFEGLGIVASIPLPESEIEEKGITKASSFALSTVSIKKLLETERDVLKKSTPSSEVTTEIIQYVDLDISFALKEFSVVLYKARDDKDTTPSDQYKTPVEEFEVDIFQKKRDVVVDPCGHDRLIMFEVIQLEAQMVQRTYDMKATVKLGAIALNQFDIFAGKEERLTIINTPQYEKDIQYLLTISYTNANKTAPEFKTKYNSTEQLIVVNFSSLLVVLHQDFLKKLLAIANTYQTKLSEIQITTPRDHYATAAEEGLIPKLKENLATIIEEDAEGKVVKKPERIRRKAKVVDSIKVKVVANMEKVAVELTCSKRPIANLQVSNFDAGVVIKTSYTEITLKLKDILVTDLNPETIHSKVLSIIGENAIQCQVVIYNLDETANYNSDDMKIDVSMGCVKIIFLNWFVQSCLTFLNNFQAAQEAIANASAAAADAAKQNVVDAYEKATRLKFNVKIKAPIIVVPIDSKSTEGIALDLGYLSITNSSTEIDVKQVLADQNKRGNAIIDEIKLELKDFKLSRVSITPPHESVALLKEIKDSDRTYGISPIANIFDPISFGLIVFRNLSYSWYKERPELDVSARIKSIELNVLVDDYVLLMSIVNKNLPEGKDEFPPVSYSKKSEDVQEALESPVTKVEVHQGGGDAPIEEGVAPITIKGQSTDLPSSKTEVHKGIEKSKIDVALKFNFQLDGIIVNLITANKEGLASFGLYVLSVKGTQLADGTLSTSVVLCDLQLDDIRPTSKTKINKYLQRRESKQKPGVSNSEENLPYMVDAVAIIKNKETFAELRVCAFDLIISIDFLLQIAHFVTLPEEQEALYAPVKTEIKASAKAPPIKKKQSQSDPNQNMELVLHLEQPDIILIENLDDFNTHAIIFNAEVNLRLRMIGDKQLIYGDVKDLKMYMCSFLPERREATKHFIIYPCTMTLQGSTPENEGLHINLKSSEVIINISPATIELINKAVVTVSGTSAEKKEKSKQPIDYSHIWAVKNFNENDHWFMKIEEAYDALEIDENPEPETAIKPEVCIIELPAIVIVLESGVGYYTTPLLTVETNLNGAIHDWSRQMRVNGNLTLTVSYYNNSLAVWEPLIEPNERIGKTTGVYVHSPWEVNFELITESKKSEEVISVDESMTKIKIHSADVLEITISKTCYDLLMEIGTAFSQAFDSQGLVKPDVVAPYVLENDTGFELTIDFTKGIFTLHDYHIPSLNPKYTEGVNSALVFQAMEEKPAIRPEDVQNCKISPNGKVFLKKKALIDIESSTSNVADNTGAPMEYLNIQIGGIKKQISIPVSKADERYFPLYRDTNQEPWGIISEVSNEYGTIKVNIHGVLKIRNHFTTTITVYRYRNEKIQVVGDVKPGEVFHVPLHAIYSAHKDLYFSLPGYKRSVQGIKWNDCLTDLTYNRQIQCDPVSTYEPFYINALREKTEVYFEVTSKFTLLSACYTIHLRPPLYLRNALPIEIKVSVAGCSVRQDGLSKGIEMEEVAYKSLVREDFLDYGEKEIKPGDVLHLPTVKLTTKSGEAKSYIVVRLIQYLEKDWSCTTEISETHEDYEVWTFSSYDSVSKMDMELGVKYENRHGSLMLTLYCPFWMINKTGLTLSYRANAESVNVLYHPPNYEGPILFSFRDKYFFGKKRASIRVDSGEWSEKIPLDVAGSTGSVQCKANDLVYTIAVHNHLTYNSLTKEITFIPFYIVINKAYFAIELQEANRPGDPWLKVEPNECIPLWPKTDTKHILHVKVPGERHVSPPFKYTEVQCTLLKMKNKYGGINVDVHVTEGGIFITFTEYHPGDAPGLVINHTSKQISFWEKGNINERILQPLQQILFSWADAAGHRKVLWDNGNERIDNDLRRDGFGQFQLGPTDKDKAFWVSFLNGTQRVLLFTERASVVAQAESSANLVKVTQEIEISIHGIGISIINNIKSVDILYVGIASSGIIWESRKKGKTRFKQMKIAQNAMMEHKYQEFLNDQEVGDLTREYFIEGEKYRVDFYDMKLKKSPEREIRRTHYPGVWLQLKTSDYQTQIHAKINRIQIDNQLLDCVFPVVLAPIPPPKSVAASTALKPFIECSIVERIVPYSTVKQFKYATILMQEFHVKVDLQFISALLEIFAKEISDEEAAKLFNLDLKSITLPLSEMVATQSQQEQKNFYDNLHLGPLKIHVSFSMAGSDVSALPTIVSTILQSVGVTLTDVNDVVFRLAFFEREYQFLTHHQLISEIATHYTGQFLKQVYVLVFGLDVLGNPYGLVVGLSKGIEDLFYEPFQGAIQGPGEFAEGLALGVKSLFGHAVGGAAGAFSKITGAMGKGIAALTFDKEYQRKRRSAINKKPANFQEGIARSSKGLVMGVVDGVTGVFTKPISGAKEQGVEGFFKGLGKGAVGLVARPTAGVVDFASGTLESVKRVAESTEDVLRMRPARFLHADGVVRPYTLSEAEGNKILRELEKGKYAKTDVFEHYEEIIQKQEVLVLSNHRIIYALKSDLFGNWVIQWTNRWQEIGMIRSMDKGVEITLKKEDKKMLGIFSSSEAQKKILFIPQKARRDFLAHKMETLRLRAE